MKKIARLGIAFSLIITIFSCKAGASTTSNELAGYTLKNKKELLQQEILKKKNKTVITAP